ncbi:MAG: hypothetical protein RL414_529 [Actinomycetota bacterium]|jgi:hypothetical protein
MKRVLILIAVVSFAISILNISQAATLVTEKSIPTKSSNFGSGCDGFTHDPHPSSHVPETINVISETICKGHRVSVQTILYLGTDLKKAPILATGHSFSKDKARIETNFPCIAGHVYVVLAVSLHADDRLRSASTRNVATVVCLRKAISPKPTPIKKK